MNLSNLTARMLVMAACAAAAGSCAPQRATDAAPTPRRVSIPDEIRTLVLRPDSTWNVADTAGAARSRELVRLFYQRRHHHSAWSHGRKPHDQVIALAERLGRLRDDGLDPDAYDAGVLERLLRAANREHPPTMGWRQLALARLDVRATYAWLRLAEHLAHGRVPAAALDADWVSDTASATESVERLDRALHRRAVVAALQALEPSHPGYRQLRSALAAYRAIASRGGWSAVPAGPPLELGVRGPRVAALIRRLAATGDYRWTVSDTVYDRRLARAVGDFQSRHGIPRSGIVGELTLAALNQPVEERIRKLALGLERWRWLPDSLGTRHVAVNIPAYRVDLVREGRIERSLRAVVGKRTSPTPVFSDQITYLELNPTWTVPSTIVVQEIVPALRRKSDFLAANRMRVVPLARARRDTSIDPRTVPWKDAASDSFQYLVVQDAGPDNPLGRLKLMCPNEYDVYLHDTPVRDRFAAAVRDFSHGCVRVAEAEELADSLIGWAPDDTTRVHALLADSTWRRLRLAKPVPVHFLYWTSWVDDSGRVQFRDDVYGLDRRLQAALEAGTMSAFELNPGVTVSPFWRAAQTAPKPLAAGRARAKPRWTKVPARDRAADPTAASRP
jgi:L,D-transpeptidase YcbB